MTAEKKAIFTGLAAGILFALSLGVLAQPPSTGVITTLPHCFTKDGSLCVGEPTGKLLEQHGDGPLKAPVGAPRPLAAVVVTSCGLAVSLFIQLDATHLLRADPRQSDIFTAVDGKQRQDTAGPMKWEDAYALAQTAVLSSHVVIPCPDDPTT